MKTFDTHVSLLHGCYEKLTGIRLPLRSICDSRRMAWERFWAAGHTVAELETVILWLKSEIRAERRQPGALRFTNLVEDLNRFEEDLGFARAAKRNEKPAPSPRELVVRQWRPAVGQGAVPITAKPVSELIADLKRSAGMKV